MKSIAIMKYSVKNNMNYTRTRWLWRRLWKGIISLSSKSTEILTAIMSNSASHFGGRNGFTGGGILSLGGKLPPPRYIVKKALLSVKRGKDPELPKFEWKPLEKEKKLGCGTFGSVYL